MPEHDKVEYSPGNAESYAREARRMRLDARRERTRLALDEISGPTGDAHEYRTLLGSISELSEIDQAQLSSDQRVRLQASRHMLILNFGTNGLEVVLNAWQNAAAKREDFKANTT